MLSLFVVVKVHHFKIVIFFRLLDLKTDFGNVFEKGFQKDGGF
jgi:hypothetical protein